MTDLNELIGRLKGAEDTTRGLDAEVMRILGWETTNKHGRLRWAMRNGYQHGSWSGPYWQSIPSITSDLNAVVALINERVPGADYLVKTCRHDKEPCWAEIFTGDDMFTGEAATPATALLIACLKALSATEKGAKS